MRTFLVIATVLEIALVVGALAVYLVLIERGGFVIASALLYAGAAGAMGSTRHARNLLTGVVLAGALFVGFTRGLDLRLPAGVLDGLG